MKILVDLGHPAHLHFFKHSMRKMEEKGHQVLIIAKEKDETLALLDAYGLKYRRVGKYHKNNLAKAADLLKIDFATYKIAKKFNPDILTGAGSVNAAHVAALLRKPCILFGDNERVWLDQKLFLPFVSVFCTPTSFRKDLGKKHIKYNGSDELAYLHPKYFQPNSAVLSEAGLKVSDKFIILRLNAWTALHDIGQSGFNFKDEEEMVRFITELEKYGKVFISTEKDLPSTLKGHQVHISPEKMHDLLYFATMYIGEGATMAAEAAVLGTPSIYVSSISLGYINELRDSYDLVRTCWNFENALEEAQLLLDRPKLKQEWQIGRQKLLQDKVDVTEFMVKLIENYPHFVEKVNFSGGTYWGE